MDFPESSRPLPREYELSMCESSHRDVKTVTLGKAVLGYLASRRRISRSPWNHARGRMNEIEKIIRARHGAIVPETDDAFIYAEALAAVLFPEFGEDFVVMVEGFMRKWYPWATQHQIEHVIFERTQRRFKDISADALGHMLHLTDAERTSLRIRTIGACDITAAQRKRRQKLVRRDRDRMAKQVARRAAGAVPRDEYLANSLTSSKPWEAFHCSRRTWERKGKPTMPKTADLPSAAS